MAQAVGEIQFGTMDVFGVGRVDQFLYPFFVRDMQSGQLTEDEAIALVQEYFLKLSANVSPTPEVGMESNAVLGNSQHCVTIGGLAPGGEPLLQADFLFDCADRLGREGVHVAVETAGLWSPRLIPGLVAAADLILFDLKHVDTGRLERATGKECGRILGNLTSLLEDAGVNLELRVTLVPGFNADPDDLVALAKWLVDRRRVPPVRLQGFHWLASSKTRLYAVSYAFADVEPVSDRELAAAARLLEDHGVSVMAV
jgi:pyruvate-formate lyase-activating enzyme